MKRNYVYLAGALLVAGLMQGCGGGGDGGSTSVTPPPANGGNNTPVVTPPATISSPVGVGLKAGLYAVSYGMGSINTKEDKSIWLTTLGGMATDGLHDINRKVYAGNDQGGPDALSDAMRDLFDPDTSRSGTALFRVGLNDANSTLIAGRGYPMTAFVTWNVGLEENDITGQSIQDFLTSNRSITKPIADLNVAGNFSAGSKGYRIDYSSNSDVFLYSRYSVWINSQEQFERSSACGATNGTANRLAYTIQPGGTLKILEIAPGTTCTTADFSNSTEIGSGTWERKSNGSVDYVQINFPADIPVSRFDSTFRESEYAAGVRMVDFIAKNGQWATGYLIPAGVHFRSMNLLLNKTAADSVKTATNM